jgi:7-keto-8-aminopelargonate synthetase-like enzyme
MPTIETDHLQQRARRVCFEFAVPLHSLAALFIVLDAAMTFDLSDLLFAVWCVAASLNASNLEEFDLKSNSSPTHAILMAQSVG